DVGEFPEDLQNLMRKAVRIEDHLDEHPADTSAQRNLSLVESKIRRLVDYYRGDRIPEHWTYNIEKARLAVE
ncbi:MAG: 30S ribosomal protein S15, partial [Candidatus Nanohaloarchaea archaeon]|nr:30S ribosomal protein S15 [Candidatus Nanohaloarchaea archaeon]